MGYTHYWRRPAELDPTRFQTFTEQVKTILEKLPTQSISAGGYYKEYPLKIYGGSGKGEPEIEQERIIFNGDRSQNLWHETFAIERIYTPGSWDKPENGLYFDSCKTERKPYDFAVCACLIALKVIFPEIKVSSDGYPEDWYPSVHYYFGCFGTCPLPDGPWGQITSL